MLFGTEGEVYQADPVLERALEVLLILHADHGQNLSTSIMRGIASGGADPYSSMAGAAAALYGPAHGGANEAVLTMLNEIGSVDKVPRLYRAGREQRGGVAGIWASGLQELRSQGERLSKRPHIMCLK